MKKFSFLYCQEPIRGSISDISFALDDILEYFISDEANRTTVREVISQFENNKENILYRQDLIKDMISNSNLLADLTSIMIKVQEKKLILTKLLSEFKEAKKQIYAFYTTFRDMIVESVSLFNDVLRLYATIDDTLAKYNHKSNAIHILRDRIEEVLNNENINKIKDIMAKANSSFDRIIVDLTSQLNIINVDFAIPNNDNKGRTVNIPVSLKTQDEFNYVYNSAARDTVDIILNINFYLLDFFGGGVEELEFYHFALKYYKTLKILNIPFCFPEIGSRTSFTGLYELNLLISKADDNNINIEANDFDACNTSGCVIVGPNNTGKTVYLRSIVSAQILGQVGLFIPAKSATIRISKQLKILYATVESNDVGGRFEQEVRAMSDALNELQENDMIVLNEYFQSTTEKECVNILYDIFTFFQERNIYWIAVTNFQSIVNKQKKFSEETKGIMKIMQTNYDFRIKEVKKQNV